MPLAISLRFPTGRYVAATMTRRDEVEWPPHPARLVLGLLSAHHRGDVIAAERAALQWLCEQDPPAVLLLPEDHCAKQVMTGVFVPQNPAQAGDVRHPRKERAFPSMQLPADDPAVLFHWPQADPDPTTRAALASLVGRLVRLGHSSSFVVGEALDELPPGDWRRLDPQPDEALSSPEHRLRVPWKGLLESAEAAFDANGRERELEAAFQKRDNAKRPLTKFDASPRGRYDARHVTKGYVSKQTATVASGPWDEGLFVMQRTGGDKLGLQSTWQLTSVLHKCIIERWLRKPEFGPVPSWISGHQAGEAGTPTGPAAHNHLAILPLAHVGYQNASGHLLGIGFAIPRHETARIEKRALMSDWRRFLACLLGDGPLSLAPPDRGWMIELSDGPPDERVALKPSTWNAAATLWQSVTPIVLDRHPKPSFRKDPDAWRASCVGIIQQACERVGLPAPVSVEPSPYSPLTGVAPAPAFAAPSPRSGRPPRFHVHAAIRFGESVKGPLAIGAGRYRGYGFLKPLPFQ